MYQEYNARVLLVVHKFRFIVINRQTNIHSMHWLKVRRTKKNTTRETTHLSSSFLCLVDKWRWIKGFLCCSWYLLIGGAKNRGIGGGYELELTNEETRLNCVLYHFFTGWNGLLMNLLAHGAIEEWTVATNSWVLSMHSIQGQSLQWGPEEWHLRCGFYWNNCLNWKGKEIPIELFGGLIIQNVNIAGEYLRFLGKE